MLTGKVAIVTGGARGIGAGIARVLASQGARVAVLDLDVLEAEKTVAGLATRGMAVSCDVALEADAAKGVEQVVEGLGGLDVLVNNAGVGRGPMDPNVPVATPGVTVSTTSRRTIPFATFGSSTCSQIATRNPCCTRRRT